MKLTRLALYLLLNALEQPGWANSPRDLKDAFSAIDKLEVSLTAENIKANIPASVRNARTQREALLSAPQWCNSTHLQHPEFTEAEKSACIKCIRALITGGLFPAGPATVQLLTAFAVE